MRTMKMKAAAQPLGVMLAAAVAALLFGAGPAAADSAAAGPLKAAAVYTKAIPC